MYCALHKQTRVGMCPCSTSSNGGPTRLSESISTPRGFSLVAEGRLPTTPTMVGQEVNKHVEPPYLHEDTRNALRRMLLYGRPCCCTSLDPRLFSRSATFWESFFDSLQGRKDCNGCNPPRSHSSACAISSQLRSDSTENCLHCIVVLNPFALNLQYREDKIMHKRVIDRAAAKNWQSANRSWSSCECKSKCEACWPCPITLHAVSCQQKVAIVLQLLQMPNRDTAR